MSKLFKVLYGSLYLSVSEGIPSYFKVFISQIFGDNFIKRKQVDLLWD